MTAKEYLNQAYHIDQRISSKLAQIESLRSLATKVTAVCGDTPHGSTPDNRRFEKTIAKIVDLENEIDADIDGLIDMKREINNVIGAVENLEYRTLLEMRYLCFQKWEQIAVGLNYDERHIFRLHGRALKELSIPE